MNLILSPERAVITEHNRGNAIKLVAEKVQSFKMFDHTFVRLAPDATNKIPEGFYDELYGGKLKVYAKHFKHYEETLNSNAIIPRFDDRIRYYLVKDGNFNLVKSKRSVIQILGDRKQEVQSFIRKSNIRFKSNRSQAIVRIAAFYDTLNP